MRNNQIQYCSNPLFPKGAEEYICDLIASYLLMPIKTVFEVMDEYIEKCRKKQDIPIQLYDWLEYLGATMGVSYYYTVICFQNIRYLGGILYEMIQKKQIEDEDKDKIKEFTLILEKYSHLFC